MRNRLAGIVLAVSALAGCSDPSAPPPVAPVLPPAVLAVQPPARTVGAAYDTDIWITFEGPLDAATVNDHTVFLKLDTRRIPSVIRLEDGAHRIRIVSREELLLRRTYTVEITDNVRTLDGGSFGETFFWQFTTNSLRHLDRPLPSAGAVDESPATGLSWRRNDESAGPVTYKVYSGLDSAAVAMHAVPPRSTKAPYVLTTQAWPEAGRIFWSVTATNDQTGETKASPVWAFQVVAPGTPVDSLILQPFDVGYLSRRTGRWVCGSLVTGGDAQVSVMRFRLDTPALASLKLASATLVFSPTTFLQSDPAFLALGMDADYGCGSSLLPVGVLQLATGVVQDNRIYCSSDLLSSEVQARIRGVQPLYGYMLTTNRTVNYAGSSITLRYYRLP